MKNNSKHTDESVPQTVAGFIKLATGQEAIQIGFTDQRVSGHAGLATFAGFLHWHRFGRQLGSWLPHRRTSPNALPAADLALGFVVGILAGASKLAQVAYLRRDVLLAPLLAIKRMGSQSSFTRFFQGFTGAGANLRCFDRAWHWCLDRLKSRREGYTLELLARLPRQVRLRLVRADSGFCHNPWLALLESQRLDYIVVARLYRPVQRLLKQDLLWAASEVPGTEVAEVMHQEEGWHTAWRLILMRHRLVEKQRPTGKRLVECPGFAYQALVTSLPHTVRPIAVWRDYNGRAGCENIIKELDAHFGLPQLCLKKFWSTEAALSLAVLSYNLCVLFQRHLGWLQQVTTGTLRFRLFTTGGILSHSGGVRTVRLSVPPAERPWWRAVFEKITSPFPNCNAVELWPA